MVASSMPIRDVETFFPVRAAPPRVLANRGANGIDGTVRPRSASPPPRSGPVVLLTGDVALLHDVGGLLAARRLGLPLAIVLVDNDGGGIFDFLPVAGERDALRGARRDAARDRLRGAAAARGRGARARRRARARSASALDAALAAPARDRHRTSARTGARTSRCTAPCGTPSGPPSSVPGHGTGAAARHPRRPPARPPGGAQTSKAIGAGDIVLLDKKGRKFHALVTELEQLESGRFELVVRPLDPRVSYRTATVREVLEVWRKRQP